MWSLTPRQFRLYLGRQRDVQRRADLATAIVASVLANVNAANGRRFTPREFMPDPPPEPARPPMVKQSWEHMLQFVVAANAKLGGDDLRVLREPENVQ